MARSQNTQRIHICLDKHSYKVLQAKASYLNKARNAYLIDLASSVTMSAYRIRAHDLTEMIGELDMLTYKASGYYNQVVKRSQDNPVIRDEDIAKMTVLFQKLSTFLEEFYKKLILERDTDIILEAAKIEQSISASAKSGRMNSHIETPSLKTYDVELVMVPQKKEDLMRHLEQAGIDCSDDLSDYFKKLIMAKYYMDLSVETEDMATMSEFIYSAKRYGKAFIIMTHSQKTSDVTALDSGELEVLYNKVLHYQREIWYIVENDRMELYKKYMKKIRLEYSSGYKNLGRKKRRREEGLWQLQE